MCTSQVLYRALCILILSSYGSPQKKNTTNRGIKNIQIVKRNASFNTEWQQTKDDLQLKCFFKCLEISDDLFGNSSCYFNSTSGSIIPLKQLNETCVPYVSPFENKTVINECVKRVANNSDIDTAFLLSTVDKFVLNRALDGHVLKLSFTGKSRMELFSSSLREECNASAFLLMQCMIEMHLVTCSPAADSALGGKTLNVFLYQNNITRFNGNISATSMSVCDVINFKNFTFFDKSKDALSITQSGAFLSQILKIKTDATLAGIKTTFQVGAYYSYEGMEPETISLVAGNPDRRTKLLSTILEISKKYDFDGVALVWLFPGCPQKTCSNTKMRDLAKMVPLLSELGKLMKNEGKISIFYSLTTDATINWFLGDYYSNVTDFVDYFIMECESQGIGTPIITLPASLQIALVHVKMLMEKTSGVYKKLLLSFSPSSINFRLIAGQGNSLGSLRSPGTIEQYMHYSQLCKWIQDDSVKRVRNSSTQNYAYSGTNLIVYDDLESLKAKVDELILANGLAGVHVKNVNGDDLNDVCGCGVAPYTRMIAELLKGGENCKPNRCI